MSKTPVRRSFFRKGVALRDRQRKVPVPKIKHKGQAVLTRVQQGDKQLVRLMSSSDAHQLVGVSKGGMAIQASGQAHRWTSETARAAAKKLWATRWKFNHRIGARLGRPSKLRPRVNRVRIRAQYVDPPPFKGILYHPPTDAALKGHWSHTEDDGRTRVISEKAALTRLGYIRGVHQPIPESIEPVWQYGRKPAESDALPKGTVNKE